MNNVKIKNNKTGETSKWSKQDFFRLFAEELAFAEDRWMLYDNVGKQWLTKVRADASGELDDVRSPFWDNLKKNFNLYSAEWTSPRGNEKIYEIL